MEFSMKITAGMGCAEDYRALAKAGTDEVFCGFVPLEWNQKFGNLLPLNRREVFFYHVQIGAWNDMRILKKMEEVYHVPVVVTFNALYYTKTQLEYLIPIIKKLTEIGFADFIIADIGLLLALKEAKISCNVHISGEIGEWNQNTIKVLMDMLPEKCENGPRLKRIIFHRKNSLKDMEACVRVAGKRSMTLEFEAFFLNEMCHYTGGFCNSLHCDELVHLCHLPYELVPIKKAEQTDEVIKKWKQKQEESEQKLCGEEQEAVDYEENLTETMLTGETGCGLCALWEMKRIGITHVKLVGRGKSAECMETDIRNTKAAIKILKEADSESDYTKKMKQKIFSGNCSGNCYYPESRREGKEVEKE